jgi:hypothetical protein
VQAAPRYHVGFAPKDSGGGVFHIHQLEKLERPQRVIEEQINIGILACLAARGSAERKGARRRDASTRLRAP